MFLVYNKRIFSLYYVLADTEVRVYLNIVKIGKLTENERVAIKFLPEAAYSFAEIAR